MKSKILLLLLMAVSLISCEENIFDMYPVEINIFVTDSEGNDLLDPEYSKNIVTDNEIIGIYNNEEYKYTDESENVDTRYYMPTMYGLAQRQAEDKYCMYFGEIDGNDDFDNQELTIVWGDGTKDVISFNRKVKMKRRTVKVDQEFFLNGKKTSLPIRIVK